MGFNPCIECGCDFIVMPVATEGVIGKRVRYLGSCGCSKDVGGYSSRESFMKDWNRRNPLPTDEEAYKAVEEETKPLCQQCLRENEDGDDHLCTLCRGKEYNAKTCMFCGHPEDSEECHLNIVKSPAPKDDQDPYEKYDPSLVPLEELESHYPDCQEKEDMYDIHTILNGTDHSITLRDVFSSMLRVMIAKHGAKPLAVALGYGVEKYFRDSWKQGFGGDYKRILKAYLRHADKYLRGEEFDGEAIGLFTKGCPHLGAMMWCLMVAKQELRTYHERAEL